MSDISPKTLVIHPIFRNAPRADGKNPEATRLDSEQLQEICALSEAISLDIIHAKQIHINTPRPATLLSVGVIEELADIIEADHIELVVINATISSVQHRNLEKQLNAKLLDRTTLILEIFGARAQSREGGWQVELAALNWQRSRVVKSWTHLERQRGGAGFMGGPGERQLEIDRRLLDEKIIALKKRIGKIKKMRHLQRKHRKESHLPIIALVGYTNAGKTTLFNQLAGASSFAEDMLFATLDTKTKKVSLKSGRDIILSDTVGFVSNLPHELIEAFRATLDEVREADLLIHVRNLSASDFAAQRADVLQVLGDIFGPKRRPCRQSLRCGIRQICSDDDARELAKNQAVQNGAFIINAHDFDACQKLQYDIQNQLDALGGRYKLRLGSEEGQLKAWLYEHGHVLQETHHDDGTLQLEVVLSGEDYGRFQKQLSRV